MGNVQLKRVSNLYDLGKAFENGEDAICREYISVDGMLFKTYKSWGSNVHKSSSDIAIRTKDGRHIYNAAFVPGGWGMSRYGLVSLSFKAKLAIPFDPLEKAIENVGILDEAKVIETGKKTIIIKSPVKYCFDQNLITFDNLKSKYDNLVIYEIKNASVGYVYVTIKDGKIEEFKKPQVGMFQEQISIAINGPTTKERETIMDSIKEWFKTNHNNNEISITRGYWHIANDGIINIRKTRKNGWQSFVSTIEGNRYYIIKTPHRVNNAPEGLESLKPDACKGMEECNNMYVSNPTNKYLRQGEWFFVPILTEAIQYGMRIKMDDKRFCEYIGCSQWALKETIKDWQKEHPNYGGYGWKLPQKERQNAHIAKRMFEMGGNIYVSGTIRHTAREHPACHLGQYWYLAYEGKDVASWDFSGRID